MARPRIGRPPVPANKKRRSQSITLDPPTWREIENYATAHGVSRSQIMDDSFKAYRGQMEDLLRHLREELASQEANCDTQAGLIKQLKEENDRLRASQQMVNSIINPYGGPQDQLTKEAKERARTLRAILNNENSVWEVGRLAEGKQDHPSLPVIADAIRSWGSPQALFEAIKAAQEAKA
jgi:hypothetical protein